MESIEKAFKGVRRGAKILARSTFTATAAFPWSRRLLNAAYLRLNASQRASLHRAFAKTFRSSRIRGRDGSWKVVFGDRSVALPLHSGSFWLDWDNAVSIAGHDIEVKQTYEALLGLPSEKPELFVDIGANYGTHSLLFLVHGVQSLTFEPNRACHDYFRNACALNHVTPKLEPVALGEERGEVEFSYPERDTWLGSTKAEVIEKLRGAEKLINGSVEQKTLDDYFVEIESKRTLIKIDTEGNELSVLEGAKKTLKFARPRVIFECWDENEKSGILNLFTAQSYSIHALPWSPKRNPPPLDFRRFMTSVATNFIALPAEPTGLDAAPQSDE